MADPNSIPFGTRLLSETTWWFLSALMAIAFLYPIYHFGVPYQYWLPNAIFIFGFFVYLRWIFLWKYTPYAWWIVYKGILSFLMIFVFFWGVHQFSQFKDFVNEIGIQEILQEVPTGEQLPLALYIQNQMTFFATAFLICTVAIPFRMLRSIWMQVNREKV